MKADIEAIIMRTCPVCWTSSFEPVEHKHECELKHPHKGEHERCLCCAQSDWIYRLASQKEVLMAGADPVTRKNIEILENMTNKEFAEYWKNSKKGQKYGLSSLSKKG